MFGQVIWSCEQWYYKINYKYVRCKPTQKSKPRFNREKPRFIRDEYNFNGINRDLSKILS